jgi:hypothetical protein
MLYVKLSCKWFIFSKIDLENLLYFNYFPLLYSVPKTSILFLIYYKFVTAGSYGKPFMGVAAAKPCSVRPPSPLKGEFRSWELSVLD